MAGVRCWCTGLQHSSECSSGSAIEIEAVVKRFARGLATISIQIFRRGMPSMASPVCRQLFAEMKVLPARAVVTTVSRMVSDMTVTGVHDSGGVPGEQHGGARRHFQSQNEADCQCWHPERGASEDSGTG